MLRVVVAAIAALIGLALLLVVAPVLLIGATLMALVAWWRPELVGRVSGSPRLSRVPVVARATPMRFALSAVALTLALTGASVAIAGNRADPTPPAPGGSAAAGPTLITPSAIDPGPTATPAVTPITAGTATPTVTPSPTPEPTPVFGEEPTGSVEIGVVTRVIDGDTIDVRVDGQIVRVRYIGIDTPETQGASEWMGAEATEANITLVSGAEVGLERDVSETDQFGRLLRYVWIDRGDEWLFVNRELLVLGFAQVTTYPPDVKYVEEVFLPAERDARDAGRGLWGTPPTPAPTATPRPTPTPRPKPPSNCHPSYEGACLKEGIGDYDCLGGSGNGPNYVRGPVYVVGYDEFDLDRDGDGIGCE